MIDPVIPNNLDDIYGVGADDADLASNSPSSAGYASGDPCPECGEPLEYDEGYAACRDDQGQDPSVFCNCGFSDDENIDWDRQLA